MVFGIHEQHSIFLQQNAFFCVNLSLNSPNIVSKHRMVFGIHENVLLFYSKNTYFPSI